jgi:hypothetical protein
LVFLYLKTLFCHRPTSMYYCTSGKNPAPIWKIIRGCQVIWHKRYKSVK